MNRVEQVAVTLDSITLDDDPTSVNGTAVDVQGADKVSVYLDVSRESTPSEDIVFTVEYRVLGDSTWYLALTGPMATSLAITSADVGSGVQREYTFDKPAGARQMRVNASSAGTDGSNTYTATVTIGTRR